MGIRGLNITVTIQRPVQGADDIVGGSQQTLTTVATGVKSRLSSLKPSQELRIQGMETDRLHNAHIWPVTTDVQEGDYYIPESGSFSGLTFRVRGVQISSILPTDPRAHISLRLERMISARTVQ